MEEYVFGYDWVSDMLHYALHHMTGGLIFGSTGGTHLVFGNGIMNCDVIFERHHRSCYSAESANNW